MVIDGQSFGQFKIHIERTWWGLSLELVVAQRGFVLLQLVAIAVARLTLLLFLIIGTVGEISFQMKGAA